MVAKLIRGGRGPQFSAIEWPSAAEPVTDGHSPLAGSDSEPADIAELQAEIASLQAELAHTRAETERQIQEAQVAGRRDGDQSTRQLLEQQFEAETSKLRAILRDLAASGPKLRRQSEQELVRLSIAIARRILHRELTIDPDALAGVVKAAFDRLDQREILQLRTDPDSEAALRKALDSAGLPRNVKIIADPALRRGSLVLETTRGELDASLETQLNEIQRGFIDIVQHS